MLYNTTGIPHGTYETRKWVSILNNWYLSYWCRSNVASQVIIDLSLTPCVLASVCLSFIVSPLIFSYLSLFLSLSFSSVCVSHSFSFFSLLLSIFFLLFFLSLFHILPFSPPPFPHTRSTELICQYCRTSTIYHSNMILSCYHSKTLLLMVEPYVCISRILK